MITLSVLITLAGRWLTSRGRTRHGAFFTIAGLLMAVGFLLKGGAA